MLGSAAMAAILGSPVLVSDYAAAQVVRDPETPYHFLRYDDVPSDQENPAWPDDFWTPLKFIPLDIAPDSYINFGGELRERLEHFTNPFFGLTPRESTTYLLHRLLIEGDLHIGDGFRTFIQLGNELATSPSTSPPTDTNQLDLQQAFADLKAPLGQGASVTFRGGRQEITFGSSRLVDVREGPNIRLSFDGGRVFYESPELRLDAFVLSPVATPPGVFSDHADLGQLFWGLYGVMPVEAVPGLHADLYYLGLTRNNATFNSGTADEVRQSLGTRLWGRADAWDYDTEGVFQFGAFGTEDIRAWTLASNTGYTIGDLWGQPRLGLQADIASGGGPGGTLKSFNPLFPKFAYFTEASINAPINMLDAFPSITVQPYRNFAVTSGVDFLWRYSIHDGFYQPPGVPLVSGSANDKRYLGEQYNLHAEWQATAHIDVNAVYVHFRADGFLKAANAKDIDYVGLWTSYKF
ncbi:MAG TPA: alginate export family protein [Alphaproteobacteria bacterium]|nr:alginate export family protein [Alphaproteobacteria bacterium]